MRHIYQDMEYTSATTQHEQQLAPEVAACDGVLDKQCANNRHGVVIIPQ